MNDAFSAALAFCLTADPAPAATPDVAAWQTQWQDIATRHEAPFVQAMLGGFAADRLGWAFASGYQAALRVLAPDLKPAEFAAFCVTEEGGNRPRDIHTRITALSDGTISVSGAKRWAILGSEISTLLVVAAESNTGEGKAALRTLRIARDADGVSFETMPPTRFTPEVPHARVRFDQTRLPASALLEGDGYARHVKPFRTIEDIHVSAAVLAYLLRESRRLQWSPAYAERLAATLSTLSALTTMSSLPMDDNADDALRHLILSGTLQWTQTLYSEADACWKEAPDAVAAQRWQRDRDLLKVASTARGLRAAKAWERLANA